MVFLKIDADLEERARAYLSRYGDGRSEQLDDLLQLLQGTRHDERERCKRILESDEDCRERGFGAKYIADKFDDPGWR